MVATGWVVSILLILIVLFSVPVLAQTPGRYKFKLATDKWTSTGGLVFTYDKIEHAIGGIAMYGALRLMGLGPLDSFALTALFWLAWEIKDGFLSYKDYGWFGGDGASWKDWVASISIPLFTIVIGV